MIIWLPEKMHNSTANKLLKMIEEPPEKTLFLLVSDDFDKVIPTILSRCQLIKIPAFTNDEIKSYLRSTHGTTESKSTDIARVANGNILRAIELCLNDESSAILLDSFRRLMRFAWKRDILSIIEWSEEMASTGREAQKNYILFSLRLLRENLMLSLHQLQNNIVFLAGEEADFSEKFHPFINKANIYPLVNEFDLAYSHIEANGNAKIVFLDLALRVAKLIR
jgi:DNA polymerase-3 subunit delta'